MGQAAKRKKYRSYFSSDCVLDWIFGSFPPLAVNVPLLSKMFTFLEKKCTQDPDHDWTAIYKHEGFELSIGMNMGSLTLWLSFSCGDLFITSDCPFSMNDYPGE
jgi:hypothetical protein